MLYRLSYPGIGSASAYARAELRILGGGERALEPASPVVALAGGLKPPTSGLGIPHSIQLSYASEHEIWHPQNDSNVQPLDP